MYTVLQYSQNSVEEVYLVQKADAPDFGAPVVRMARPSNV